MARSLGIETVAEAIETAAQADWMRSLGCTYAQGFYFDRPMLAEELPAVARNTVVSLAEEAAEAEAAAEITRARSRRRRKTAASAPDQPDAVAATEPTSPPPAAAIVTKPRPVALGPSRSRRKAGNPAIPVSGAA